MGSRIERVMEGQWCRGRHLAEFATGPLAIVERSKCCGTDWDCRGFEGRSVLRPPRVAARRTAAGSAGQFNLIVKQDPILGHRDDRGRDFLSVLKSRRGELNFHALPRQRRQADIPIGFANSVDASAPSVDGFQYVHVLPGPRIGIQTEVVRYLDFISPYRKDATVAAMWMADRWLGFQRDHELEVEPKVPERVLGSRPGFENAILNLAILPRLSVAAIEQHNRVGRWLLSNDRCTAINLLPARDTRLDPFAIQPLVHNRFANPSGAGEPTIVNGNVETTFGWRDLHRPIVLDKFTHKIKTIPFH